MDSREKASLDRYITGNYGEDQFAGEVNPDEIVRVMVTGDREWTDGYLIEIILSGFLNYSTVVIIEGCGRGADQFAHDWSPGGYNVLHEHFPAKWKELGKAAGPSRNQEMVEAKPDIVYAFHDQLGRSRGTIDAVGRARDKGIPVIHIRHV